MADDNHQLGQPVSEEIQQGEWTVRHYDNATVYRHPKYGTYEIPGSIRDYWMNGLFEKLGFPTGDLEHRTVANRSMDYIPFERGGIYQDKHTNIVFDVSEDRLDNIFKAISPMIYGKWDTPFEEGVVGVHMALLHTNEVLLWTYEDTFGDHDHANPNVGENPNPAKGEWSLLSLTSGKQIIKKGLTDRNQFCGGQCLLGDGRVLAVGGDRHNLFNHKTVQTFHPESRSWKKQNDLEVGRWYPTVVTVGEKFALVVGGDDAPEWSPPNDYHVENPTAQFVYDDGNTTAPHKFDNDFYPPSVYPFVFVVPNDTLFVHLGNKTRITKIAPANFETAEKLINVEPGSRTYGLEGTAVLLPLKPADNYRSRIMIIGGGNEPLKLKTPAKNSCEILDLGANTRQWVTKKPMNHRRVMPDAVLLPNGKVFVANGSKAGLADVADEPVYEAEIYDPELDTWAEMAAMKIPRLYHATAILLPDGRILCAGSDREWNPYPYDLAHTQLEVFSPPYLFAGGSRPAIKLAPKEIKYGNTFQVATDQADTIQSAVLIRNGSCTHSFNSDQRFVELDIKNRLAEKVWIKWNTISIGNSWFTVKIPIPNPFSSKGLELKAPPNSQVAPPGYYMLFLLSATGVPSVASFIRIRD